MQLPSSARPMPPALLAPLLLLVLALFHTAHAETFAPGIITEDTTWTKEAGPYIIDTLVIPERVTLTILPGTVVKLGQPGCNCYENIWVDGRLVVGARDASERAFITSIKDDLGGDSNGDGSASSPQAGDWRQIRISAQGVLELSHADVRYGGYAESPHIYFNPDNVRQINNSGTVMMDDADIGYGYTANYRQGYGGTTTIQHSSIHDAYLGTVSMGLDIYAGTVAIHNSSIQGNRDYGLYNRSADTIDATGNYWGDPSGPTHPSNPGGTGDRVSDNVDFGDYLRCDPLATEGADRCASNVLFLPGIESSRLYAPLACDTGICEKLLWEPDGDELSQQLANDTSGASVNPSIYTKPNDIIDNAYFPIKGNIYKSFIEDLDALAAAGTINDWEAIPYDWRLSPDQILSSGKLIGDEKISYLLATSSPYLMQELKHLAHQSRTKKVTIIAHSNGGLVVKRLTETLGPDAVNLIDKIILVASPQSGTPQAISALLHGDNQGLPFDAFPYKFSKEAARALSLNMPMAYNLMPSSAYFTHVDDPVITIDASLPEWRTTYGSTIHSSESLRRFLTDTTRVKPAYDDLVTPEIGNAALFDQAAALHANALDNWEPPSGVQLIQIAGWGIPTTRSGIAYAKVRTCKGYIAIPGACDYSVDEFTATPIQVIDGDGTVVAPSALWTSTTTGAVNYWMDLNTYNKDHPLSSLGGPSGFAPFKHANILEVEELRTFLIDTITSLTKPLSTYTYLSTEAPRSSDHRLRYALHSPLSLHLYDDQGRHTGISTTTGQVEEDIPGTYYDEFGEVKYVFTDTSTTNHIIMNGYATGTFTLVIDEFEGDTLIASTTWKDIPTTPTTSAVLDVVSNVTTASPMFIDVDGDGSTDITLAPVLNETVTLPLPPVYRFGGFLQPINDTTAHPELAHSVFKGGSTIPVKFQLKDANGDLVQASTTPIWLAPERLSPINASANETPSIDAGTSGTSYRWDEIDQQYIYNWSTKGFTTGYWYRVSAQLDDGTIRSVTVGLR